MCTYKLKVRVIINFINNSSSLITGNHDRMVYGCQILISIDIYDFYFSVFSSVFISIEKTYITLKTVFEHRYSWKTLRIFNSLLGVGKVVKHYLLCMIHHTNWGIFEKSKNFLSRAKNWNQKAWKALEDPRWPCWLHEKRFSVSP